MSYGDNCIGEWWGGKGTETLVAGSEADSLGGAGVVGIVTAREMRGVDVEDNVTLKKRKWRRSPLWEESVRAVADRMNGVECDWRDQCQVHS